MLVSFLLLGGFLYWLNITAEPTQGPVITEETDEPDAADGTTVDGATLLAMPEQYLGQRVRVQNVEVASPVGSQAFFVNLRPQSPFLVVMDSALVAQGTQLPTGTVTLAGTVHAMTDSIIDAWTEAGVVTPADRPVVEFAIHYLLAGRITPAAGAQGGSEGN
jgi:hypothetical protein